MHSTILSEPYAGLQAQALGLAEASGLAPDFLALAPKRPWSLIPAAFWPAPLHAVGLDTAPPAKMLFTAGGTAAAVGAVLRKRGATVVQVQNPRMDVQKFDLVVANRHDRLRGKNVIVTRTALHRATPARLAEAAALWGPRLGHLKRPLVAVLVGGSNGRFRLESEDGVLLGARLAGMMLRDRVGVAVTPSRRTAPAVRDALRSMLTPLGGYVWDMHGENPYFGLLALADVIVATIDSISMMSEAVATSAPVLVAELPGKSARIRLFRDDLIRDGRIRVFDGKFATWKVHPIDDTAEAASEMRRRLGF